MPETLYRIALKGDNIYGEEARPEGDCKRKGTPCNNTYAQEVIINLLDKKSIIERIKTNRTFRQREIRRYTSR